MNRPIRYLPKQKRLSLIWLKKQILVCLCKKQYSQQTIKLKQLNFCKDFIH